MTAILRAGLVAALAASFFPAIAAGQDTTAASLLRRIEVLERANADLERRVRELESLMKSEPPQGQSIRTSTRWRDLANWRRLRLGMNMNEVRALLGEPKRVDAGLITFWRWPDGDVQFMDGTVRGWSEPDR